MDHYGREVGIRTITGESNKKEMGHRFQLEEKEKVTVSGRSHFLSLQIE